MAHNPRLIASPQNPTFKLCKKLLESTGIKKEGLFLVSGERILHDLFTSRAASMVQYLLVDEECDARTLDRILTGKTFKIFRVASGLFRELDVANTKNVLAVCASPELKRFEDQSPKGLEVVLALSDPLNLGAAIRTCVAFAAAKIILCEECANPFLPKVVKTSAGACITAPLVRGPKLMNLKADSLTFAIDQGGMKIHQFKPGPSLRLVLGREGQGIPDSLKNLNKISIPIASSVESLNAMVALGIVLAKVATL